MYIESFGMFCCWFEKEEIGNGGFWGGGFCFVFWFSEFGWLGLGEGVGCYG